MRLKPIVKHLAGIEAQLTRLADCWEYELAQSGYPIKPSKPGVKDGVEPTVSYVDEEEDWARESIEYLKREEERARQAELEQP